MDVLSYVGVVSQFSFVLFIIMFGFLVYEVFLFQKERSHRGKPHIPQFNQSAPGVGPTPVTTPVVVPTGKGSKLQLHAILIGMAVIMMVIFGVVAFLSISNSQLKTPTAAPQVQIQKVQSKGIHIYRSSWQEVSPQELSSLKPGEQVFLGIESIKETPIDRARIRVNQLQWQLNDITTNYRADKNVYYKEYVIASNEANLKIEAQLHSPDDGWLGE